MASGAGLVSRRPAYSATKPYLNQCILQGIKVRSQRLELKEAIELKEVRILGESSFLKWSGRIRMSEYCINSDLLIVVV